jgi:hypothetical protein
MVRAEKGTEVTKQTDPSKSDRWMFDAVERFHLLDPIDGYLLAAMVKLNDLIPDSACVSADRNHPLEVLYGMIRDAHFDFRSFIIDGPR